MERAIQLSRYENDEIEEEVNCLFEDLRIVADAPPSIDSVKNLFTGKKDGTATYGKAARIDAPEMMVEYSLQNVKRTVIFLKMKQFGTK